jgi:hypothetical protein
MGGEGGDGARPQMVDVAMAEVARNPALRRESRIKGATGQLAFLWSVSPSDPEERQDTSWKRQCVQEIWPELAAQLEFLAIAFGGEDG